MELPIYLHYTPNLFMCLEYSNILFYSYVPLAHYLAVLLHCLLLASSQNGKVRNEEQIACGGPPQASRGISCRT